MAKAINSEVLKTKNCSWLLTSWTVYHSAVIIPTVLHYLPCSPFRPWEILLLWFDEASTQKHSWCFLEEVVVALVVSHQLLVGWRKDFQKWLPLQDPECSLFFKAGLPTCVKNPCWWMLNICHVPALYCLVSCGIGNKGAWNQFLFCFVLFFYTEVTFQRER